MRKRDRMNDHRVTGAEENSLYTRVPPIVVPRSGASSLRGLYISESFVRLNEHRARWTKGHIIYSAVCNGQVDRVYTLTHKPPPSPIRLIGADRWHTNGELIRGRFAVVVAATIGIARSLGHNAHDRFSVQQVTSAREGNRTGLFAKEAGRIYLPPMGRTSSADCSLSHAEFDLAQPE